MFHFARARRTKPQPTELSTDQPPAEPPAAALLPAGYLRRRLELVPVVSLRVGDYEVGEGYCPQLCGHPGIRY